MTASAVSLALLATACGSDKPADKKDEPKGGASSAAAAAPAAKAKTDAELATLLVTQADLSDQLVKQETAAKAAAAPAVQTDKPECKPLAQIQSLQKVGSAAGVARTVTVAKPKEPAANASAEEKLKASLEALQSTATSVSLTSYDGKGAEEAFASLKAAGTACAGGYSVTQEGDTTKIDSVAPGTAVTAGDEALSLTTVMNLDDAGKAKTHIIVVRKGNTLAGFSALSLGGDAVFPKTVVDAQAKKLG
ncbi:hypothetical protein [Streptomyces bambusae]|uniref:Lipoprotein n=1 Tax=Streptomyces bambusae TaxID=1550616 RepID=A0ABS6ZCX8_9ACTN|nr:hypothetical protein [Streptomyces bambusae]MBW5485597.1 hypothetical protein [Streptomyces bambusae]